MKWSHVKSWLCKKQMLACFCIKHILGNYMQCGDYCKSINAIRHPELNDDFVHPLQHLNSTQIWRCKGCCADWVCCVRVKVGPLLWISVSTERREPLPLNPLCVGNMTARPKLRGERTVSSCQDPSPGPGQRHRNQTNQLFNSLTCELSAVTTLCGHHLFLMQQPQLKKQK